MHVVLVNRLGGLSLPRKSVVRLTDRPDMTLDVYRGRKTTKQKQHSFAISAASKQVSCPNKRLIRSSGVWPGCSKPTTVITLNIGTPRPATVVVLNIKQFDFTLK